MAFNLPSELLSKLNVYDLSKISITHSSYNLNYPAKEYVLWYNGDISDDDDVLGIAKKNPLNLGLAMSVQVNNSLEFSSDNLKIQKVYHYIPQMHSRMSDRWISSDWNLGSDCPKGQIWFSITNVYYKNQDFRTSNLNRSIFKNYICNAAYTYFADHKFDPYYELFSRFRFTTQDQTYSNFQNYMLLLGWQTTAYFPLQGDERNRKRTSERTPFIGDEMHKGARMFDFTDLPTPPS